jgi:hypothetical protein
VTAHPGVTVEVVLYALAVWTLFVWTTRIRNIIDDGGAWGTSRVVDLAVAVTLVALGVLAVATARRGRPAWAVPALVVATVAVWAVRAPGILLDGQWSAGFKVVHTVLALVSIALAALAWRAWRSHRTPAPVAA